MLVRDKSGDESMVVMFHRAGAPMSFDSYDLNLLTSGLAIPDGVDEQVVNRVKPMIDKLARGETIPCPKGLGAGFSDIRRGAQVVVRNESGKTLGLARLSGGVLDVRGCSFEFELTVPSRPFYSIEVSHRGSLTYSSRQLARRGWQVEMRVG